MPPGSSAKAPDWGFFIQPFGGDYGQHSQVHPTRMPVILDAQDYEAWLTGSDEAAGNLLRPFSSERMQIVREGVGLTADSD